MHRAPLNVALVALLALVAIGLGENDVAHAKGNSARVLDGPGIEQPLSIPYPDGWLDWAEFFPGAIEPLELAPNVVEEPVTVWSVAWFPLLGLPSDTISLPEGALEGRYYSAAGVVAVDASDGERWYALDADRRDVLDRYIALARIGTLPEEPLLVSAYLAAWQHLDEPMPFELRIDHQSVTADDVERFWTLLAEAEQRAILPSEFKTGASHFSPWSGGVWPVSESGNATVEFCSDGTCDAWRLMPERGLLANSRLGWPAWDAFAVSAELQAFIEEHAQVTPPLIGPLPDANGALAHDDDSSRGIGTIPMLSFLVVLLGLAMFATVVVRRAR